MKPVPRLLTLCLLVSFFWAPLSAQTYKLADESVVPPSPTSTVYQRYAGWTPDLATGAATLAFPLYDVKVANWSLPFSLQYSSTGIKVNATPYPAGYGWAFLPGLRITRTICGRADLWYDRDIQDAATADFDYEKLTVYDAVHGNQPLLDEDMLDSQYDIFTVSLPGESCRFILVGENGVYHAETVNTLLKIEILGTKGAGFKVTDGNGVVYWFGDDSTTPGFDFTEYVDNRYPTAWMLRKVVIPGTGNEVTFNWYKGNGSGLGNGYWLGSHIVRDRKPSQYDTDSNPSFDDATVLGTLEGSYDYPTILMLKQVNFPGGKVVFNYESFYIPLLTEMTVSNVNGNTVRKATLSYGPAGIQHRLLKSLYLSDDGTYGFSYYNESTGFSNIYAQDWWGYYNGKSNTSLVPQISLRVYAGEFAPGQYQTYGYADRSIDSSAMKTNSLQRIIYPGGGWTEFSYEPHSFDGAAPTTQSLGPASRIALTQGAGLRVSSVTTSGASESVPIVKTYSYGPSSNGKGNVGLLPTPDTFIGEYYCYESKQMGEASIQRKGFNLRMLYLNTQSDYDRLQTGCPDVWYDTVTETLGDGSKTVYTFSRPVMEDTYADAPVYDFSARTILDYNTLFGPGCVLTSQKEYAAMSAGGGLTREMTHQYEVIHEDTKDVTGLVVLRKEISRLSNGPDFLFTSNGAVNSPEGTMTEQPVATYNAAPCRIRFRYARKIGTTTKEYTAQGPVTETESLYYNGPLIQSKTVTDGTGESRVQTWLYPESWSQAVSAQRPVLQAMYGLNMRAMPFLSTVTTTIPRTEGAPAVTMTDEIRTEYALSSGTNLYLPSKVVRIRNGMEASVREYGYDARGNLQSVVRDGFDKMAWLWAYGSLHPVMEISGMSYDEVRNLSPYNVDNLRSYTNSPSILSLTSTLRATIGAHGTTRSFTWEPLLGITSETDARGWKTIYQYDSQGRLSAVKGGDGNMLVRYGYHRVSDASLSVSFNTSSYYSYGTSANITASGRGGTGHATYQWTMKNAGGTTVYSSASSENPSCSIPMTQQGVMTLVCSMTDLFTGETATDQHSFTVSPPVIAFSDVSSSAGTASGYITTNDSVQITFYLDYSLGYGLSGSAMIAGTLYEFDGVSSQVIQASVNGTASFTINIQDTGMYGSTGDVSLTITGVPSGYSIGTPSSITTNY